MPMKLNKSPDAEGFTLMELLLFITVVGIGLGVLAQVYARQVGQSVDPLLHLRAVECAQAQMEAMIARRYDGNSPSGGLQACGSQDALDAQGNVIDCDATPFSSATVTPDDIMDYTASGWTKNPFLNDCNLTVTVQNNGGSFTYLSGLNHGRSALENKQARLITITSKVGNTSYQLKAYRVNF